MAFPKNEKKMVPDFCDTIVNLLTELPNLTAVCKLLGVTPNTVHTYRRNNPEFNERVNEALEYGYDMLEAEAIRRGKEGVDKPVFYQGIECGSVREYSDTLLITMMKACRPKKFNPGVDVKVGNGEKVVMTFNMGGTN